MLDRKPPFAGVYATIGAADTDTASDGSLLDINLAYGFDPANPSAPAVYKTCATWSEFLECARIAYATTNIDRIWFHNGGRFDFVPLVLLLLKGELSDLVEKFDTCMVGGCLIEVKITMRRTGKGRKPRQIRLTDSLRLMPSALSDLAKGFKLDGKDYVPDDYKSRMQDYKREHPADYAAYHKRDTILLLHILHLYRDTLNQVAPVGNLNLTAAATALKVFQTSFLDCEIITPGKAERQFTRLAYQGGRCEYIGDGRPAHGTRATYTGTNIYDVNSQYPAMMVNNLYPSAPGVFTSLDANARAKDGSILPGCYRARYAQRHGRVALLKPCLEEGKVSKEAQWSGETHATHIELNEIERAGGTVQIIEGYFYDHACMKPLFHDFVTALYARRLQAEREGNAALKYVVKIMMNSLYGKFGIGETGERLVVLSPDEFDEQMAKEDPPELTPIPELGDDAYLYREAMHAPCAFPAIAAFVTAAARLNLLSCANDYGVGIIYCDTDSVHTQDPFPPQLIDAHTLGRFKCETPEGGVTMLYGGRKIYVNMTDNKAKCKGVPSRSVNPVELAHAIENNAPIKADYRSPSGIKIAIKRGHDNPNEFRAYSRTVTPAVSTATQGLLHAR